MQLGHLSQLSVIVSPFLLLSEMTSAVNTSSSWPIQISPNWIPSSTDKHPTCILTPWREALFEVASCNMCIYRFEGFSCFFFFASRACFMCLILDKYLSCHLEQSASRTCLHRHQIDSQEKRRKGNRFAADGFCLKSPKNRVSSRGAVMTDSEARADETNAC